MNKVPEADMLKCMKCNICFSACSRKAISVIINSCCAKCIKYCIAFTVPCHPEHISFDYNLCDSCGDCVEKCPNEAIYWSYLETAVLKWIGNR